MPRWAGTIERVPARDLSVVGSVVLLICTRVLTAYRGASSREKERGRGRSEWRGMCARREEVQVP